MNARSKAYALSLEAFQVEEAMEVFVHSLLLHRSLGKFTYASERNYSIGNLGLEDIDCDSIDLTYLRLSSPELAKAVRSETRGFREALCPSSEATSASPPRPSTSSGAMALEFYQRRRRQWPLPEDVVPWEVWRLDLRLLAVTSGAQRDKLRESVGEALGEILFDLAMRVNGPCYQPKMPLSSELTSVFDGRFADCQPYLYRVRFDLGPSPFGSSAPSHHVGSLGNTMKKLLKDTLSM